MTDTTILERMQAENAEKIREMARANAGLHPFDMLKLRLDIITEWTVNQVAALVDTVDPQDESSLQTLENNLELTYETALGAALDGALGQVHKNVLGAERPQLLLPS